MLDKVPGGSLAKSIVVEAAVNSNLAPMLNRVYERRPGVAGLTRPSAEIDAIAESHDAIAAPVILAAHPPVPVPAIASGIANLRFLPGRYERVIVLVHVLDAPQLVGILPECDQYACLWDLADPPSLALAKVAELLSRHQCLSPTAWAGLHFYSHPKRPVADAAQALKEYQTALVDFPDVLNGA